ncbi:hypothetical protein [Micromonospora aurantiaca (nom. illeg.)]|uniref:hypothetical protein n=1 Tax=Micromonospora aurantiaca (nom. illeg.) TaxID=47850 RepID=UPI0034060250
MPAGMLLFPLARATAVLRGYRVRLAYGPARDRLRTAERRHDPHGTFSAVPTLRPPGPATGRPGRIGGSTPSTGDGGRYDFRRAVADARHTRRSGAVRLPPARAGSSRVVGQLFRSPQGVGRQVDPEERLA